MTKDFWPACKGAAHQAALRRHLAEQDADAGTSAPYPEQINLPFNFGLIRSGFEFRHPSTDPTDQPGYWIIIQGGSVIMQQQGDAYLLPEGELPPTLSPRHPPLHIGLWHGKPLRVISIASDAQIPAPFVSDGFNASEDRLDPATLTLAGLGKQILHWERQSRHCSRCGGAMERLPASWGKRCTACRTEHYPHIHPCAIVLVSRGSELLLVRKREWAPGRYGLVAGFLDFGESLEECAIREVKEETGIDICNVRYVASQNWPFPAQLMAGFVADYAGGDIRVDTHELEDARWFTPDQLPTLPPKRSIARYIVDTFGR